MARVIKSRKRWFEQTEQADSLLLEVQKKKKNLSAVAAYLSMATTVLFPVNQLVN